MAVSGPSLNGSMACTKFREVDYTAGAFLGDAEMYQSRLIMPFFPDVSIMLGSVIFT